MDTFVMSMQLLKNNVPYVSLYSYFEYQEISQPLRLHVRAYIIYYSLQVQFLGWVSLLKIIYDVLYSNSNLIIFFEDKCWLLI